MKGIYFFIVGVIFTLTLQFSIAQTDNSSFVQLNHIGISVPDIDEAVDYYTEVIGFKEAFRSRTDSGERYRQITKISLMKLPTLVFK